MKTRKVSIVIIAAFVGGLVFGLSDAGSSEGIAVGKRSRGPKKFTVSGVYNGPLSGLCLIGDDSIEIVDETKIFKIGLGQIDVGTMANNAGVTVTGVIREDKMIATAIIVAEPESGRDFSEATLPDAEAKPGRAQ